MRITSYNSNNQNQTTQVSFRSGMTPAIRQQIEHADVLEISRSLADKGIVTDFKDNKVIAWCSEKVVNIFEILNKKYHAGFALPPLIATEDFTKFRDESSRNITGCCLFAQDKILQNSKQVFPEKSILFNSFETKIKTVSPEDKWKYSWENIDNLADENYNQAETSTSHFLEIFLHEFSHAAHKNHLDKMIPADELPYLIKTILEEKALYNLKYGSQVSSICEYARVSRFEAIACDLSRLISKSLDKDLNVIKNPIKNTPYENKTLLKELFSHNTKNETELNRFLMEFWNGYFEQD